MELCRTFNHTRPILLGRQRRDSEASVGFISQTASIYRMLTSLEVKLAEHIRVHHTAEAGVMIDHNVLATPASTSPR